MRDYRNTAIGSIVNEKGKLLICRSPRDENKWKFPQGGIESGESAKDALFREIREELNIQLKDEDIIQALPAYFSYFFERKEQVPFEIRLHPFLIRLKEPVVHLNHEEFVEFKWVDMKELLIFDLGIRKNAYLEILNALKIT